MGAQTLKLTEILTSQENEFKSFNQKIVALVGQIESKLLELKTEEAAQSKQKEFLNKEALRLEELDKKSNERKTALDKQQRDNERQAEKNEESLKLIAEKEKKQAEKDKLLADQTLEINQGQNEIKKKLQWAEMEERRLKLFEHKLNLIAEDKEIKAKLKELT